ncbi:hypothetical protein [Streptomyces sp. NPDC042319]|uniref:Lrp/AsnC family transcriptional regulator n=1 Tax=Streptomyces sp. NPDC042319 TaxID=3154332 RepID=UPI003408FE26
MSRTPGSASTRRFGVARATVQARVDTLQRNGILIRWRPQFDPAAMGCCGPAYVRLHIAQGMLGRTLDRLTGIPEVIEANAVAGNADLARGTAGPTLRAGCTAWEGRAPMPDRACPDVGVRAKVSAGRGTVRTGVATGLVERGDP